MKVWTPWKHFRLRMSRPIPIVGEQRMISPRQSAKLWSFLTGLVVSSALIGCAGGGEIGPNQSGNGGSDPVGAGGTGNANATGRGGSTGGGNAGGGSSSNPVYLPASVRRLTNAEYDASVQALLGTTKTPSTNFPPDSRQAVGLHAERRAAHRSRHGQGAGRRGHRAGRRGPRRQQAHDAGAAARTRPRGGRGLRADVHHDVRRRRRSAGALTDDEVDRL